ncbi:MAG: hypothetical protein HFJ50_05890 [Clostridia bacterium]|jgi:hypothetical protein|nr:hypothetical protein [Clostridia bacterium]
MEKVRNKRRIIKAKTLGGKFRHRRKYTVGPFVQVTKKRKKGKSKKRKNT